MAEADTTQSAVEFDTTNPPTAPTMNGDPQTAETSAFLKRAIQEDRYNAFCIDCQRNRSSHCNVSFGTFMCSDCATVHKQTYSPFECYVKPLFGDCWDTFQLRTVEVGGNKRFFDFLSEYQRERDDIANKYSSKPAQYYRRMIGSWANKVRFEEERPAKNWSELVQKTNEQYAIADTASSAYESTKTGLTSFWARMTAPAEGEAAGATGVAARQRHQ